MRFQKKMASDTNALELSGLEPLKITPEFGFAVIGERTNITGSPKFSKLILAGDFEGALAVARQQVQGGDPAVCDDLRKLPAAREKVELRSDGEGRVARIACRAVGRAAMLLGAGRETVDSRIDPAVGLVLHKKVGDLVIAGEPLMTVHVNERRRLPEARGDLDVVVRRVHDMDLFLVEGALADDAFL